MLAALLGALSLFHAVPAQAQAPAAPTGLTVSPGDTSLFLSWTAGTGAQRYHVHYTTAASDTVANSATASGSDPSAAWVSYGSPTSTVQNMSSLTNGTPYRVRVRSNHTTNGNSAWVFGSGTPMIILNWERSTWPMDEHLDLGDQIRLTSSGITVSSAVSATVTYAAGSSNPASLTDDLQTGYATTVTAAANAVPTLRLAVPVDDTVNEEHETFDITINAGTGYTVGTPSTITVTITDNDPPAAPALTVTPGNWQLTASWVKPDGPVTEYELRFKEASAPDREGTGSDLSTGWRTQSQLVPSTSLSIPALTADTDYHVQVRATDGQSETGNGYGDWSALQTATTPAPNLLTGLTVHDGTQELFLDANRADGLAGLGGPDALYTVQVNPGIHSVTVTPTWTNSAITGVDGDVHYVTYGRDGTAVSWSQSGTGMPVSLVLPGLGTPGTTRLTLTLTGDPSQTPYKILFQHNFDWESANNRLEELKMRASQSQ